jgi:Divergent InlB B-repeat domain
VRTSLRRIQGALRVLGVAAFIAVAAAPGLLPGQRSPSPVFASSGGCSLSSSTCYLFDVHMVGTGFGTYQTMGDDGTYTGRINCRYGNETQTGVCGWGYEPASAGDTVDVFYFVNPDPGSKACDSIHCYEDGLTADRLITGNYAEQEWHFELIQHFQIDVAITGTGSGTVTSNPPGISCPGDCDDLFAANIGATLTAKAAAGSVFAGWSGDCTGTKTTCPISSDFLQSVTAKFNKKTTPAPATATPTEAPTEEPTAEVTAEPTEEATPTAEPTPTATPEVTASAEVTPIPTAAPITPTATDGGNTLLVVGLGIVLVGLVAGALFFARRGSPG